MLTPVRVTRYTRTRAFMPQHHENDIFAPKNYPEKGLQPAAFHEQRLWPVNPSPLQCLRVRGKKSGEEGKDIRTEKKLKGKKRNEILLKKSQFRIEFA